VRCGEKGDWCPPPLGGGSREGAVPLPREVFLNFEVKNAVFYAFLLQ